jgi:N6-adenosine-specific RNA methylase IME4
VDDCRKCQTATATPAEPGDLHWRLATRGRPKRISAGVHQVIMVPRTVHSATPHEAYDRIERLLSGPRLELFARNARPGWVSLGNEVDRRRRRDREFQVGMTATRGHREHAARRA